MSTEETVEAIWDALDDAHGGQHHIHASECCWPFRGVLDVIREHLRPLVDTEKQRAVEEALDEVEVRQAWARQNGAPPTDTAAYEAWRVEFVAARDEMRAQVREPLPSRIHRERVVTSIEELRASAQKAADVRPGPWKVWAMEVLADPLGTSDLDDAVPVARTALLIDGKPRTHLADFIATFDPPMVLDLLDRLEWAERQVAAVEALADEIDRPTHPGCLRINCSDCVGVDMAVRLRAALATEEAT